MFIHMLEYIFFFTKRKQTVGVSDRLMSRRLNPVGSTAHCLETS